MSIMEKLSAPPKAVVLIGRETLEDIRDELNRSIEQMEEHDADKRDTGHGAVFVGKITAFRQYVEEIEQALAAGGENAEHT